MFIRLISIFILIPLIELVILIKVGSYIGLWPTILIVVLTGILGASLARYQGFMIINKIKSDVNSGRVPAQELIDGLLVLVGWNCSSDSGIPDRYIRFFTVNSPNEICF